MASSEKPDDERKAPMQKTNNKTSSGDSPIRRYRHSSNRHAMPYNFLASLSVQNNGANGNEGQQEQKIRATSSSSGIGCSNQNGVRLNYRQQSNSESPSSSMGNRHVMPLNFSPYVQNNEPSGSGGQQQQIIRASCSSGIGCSNQNGALSNRLNHQHQSRSAQKLHNLLGQVCPFSSCRICRKNSLGKGNGYYLTE